MGLLQGQFYLVSVPVVEGVRELGSPPLLPHEPLTWGEDLIWVIIGVTGLAGFVGLGLLVDNGIGTRHRRRQYNLG